MDPITPAALDATIFHRNMAALRQVDAALADRLVAALEHGEAAAQSLRSAVPAVTRDGRLSYRLPAGSESVWLGRSSIPAVRAEALLEQFHAGDGNVFLPGAASGLEALLLTQRLAAHQAVFVWEQSEAPLVLILRLHDFEQPIRQQRLTFVLAEPDRLTETLVQWLELHPAHACPTRILVWPWQSFAELAACRAAIERACESARNSRQSG